jgi:hypothetical protein
MQYPINIFRINQNFLLAQSVRKLIQRMVTGLFALLNAHLGGYPAGLSMQSAEKMVDSSRQRMPKMRPNVEYIIKARQHSHASEQAEMHGELTIAMHHAAIAIDNLLLWQKSIIDSREIDLEGMKRD